MPGVTYKILLLMQCCVVTICAYAALLLASAPVAAAAGQSSPPEEIVVTGKKLPEITNDFVRNYTAPSVTLDQIARWREPLCIRTMGLAPNLNAFITARLRQVAAQIGAPKTKAEPCQVDLDVSFTVQPQELLNKISAKNPRVLGPHYPSERKKLATMTRPIQAWYSTNTRDLFGTAHLDTYDKEGEQYDPYATLMTGMMAGPIVRRSYSSWMKTGLTSEFASVVVIADLTKVNGRDIDTVADYIALMAFARGKTSDKCQEVPSIANLFENCSDGLKAKALSDYDMAYLKALYASPSDVRLGSQASEMGALMQTALEKQFAEKKAAAGLVK